MWVEVASIHLNVRRMRYIRVLFIRESAIEDLFQTHYEMECFHVSNTQSRMRIHSDV